MLIFIYDESINQNSETNCSVPGQNVHLKSHVLLFEFKRFNVIAFLEQKNNTSSHSLTTHRIKTVLIFLIHALPSHSSN